MTSHMRHSVTGVTASRLDEQGTFATSAEGDTTLILLKVEEAARRLGIGRTTCLALIGAGELESVMVGGLRRVPADAVPEYVTRLRTTHRTAPRVV